MNWKRITSLDELEQAFKESDEKPILLFKHSTRCSISSTALARFERKWQVITEEKVTPYFLDLVQFRHVSDAIAIQTGVQHESPQVILVHKGKVLYQASHNGIVYDDLLESLAA
jgi:bacillithiol system protein YtxJ